MDAFHALVASACGSQSSICNPLSSSLSTIPGFLAAVLRVGVVIAMPLISLAVVYSGFLFIMARGNEQKLITARRNFLFVVVGAVLVLGAWELANILGATVTQLTQ